jgi:hypothetical protein
MDAPGQEPSVTMLDWSTGLGTAKYWVNDLLLSSYVPGKCDTQFQGSQGSLFPAVLPRVAYVLYA